MVFVNLLPPLGIPLYTAIIMCYIAWQSYVKWKSVMTLMSLAYVTRVMVLPRNLKSKFIPSL